MSGPLLPRIFCTWPFFPGFITANRFLPEALPGEIHVARALLAKELHFVAGDETGLLGRVTTAMALEGVYIIHLSCYSFEGKGYFQAVVRDSEKAKKAIGYFIPSVEERDVLIVAFENKAGTLAPLPKPL